MVRLRSVISSAFWWLRTDLRAKYWSHHIFYHLRMFDISNAILNRKDNKFLWIGDGTAVIVSVVVSIATCIVVVDDVAVAIAVAVAVVVDDVAAAVAAAVVVHFNSCWDRKKCFYCVMMNPDSAWATHADSISCAHISPNRQSCRICSNHSGIRIIYARTVVHIWNDILHETFQGLSRSRDFFSETYFVREREINKNVSSSFFFFVFVSFGYNWFAKLKRFRYIYIVVKERRLFLSHFWRRAILRGSWGSSENCLEPETTITKLNQIKLFKIC